MLISTLRSVLVSQHLHTFGLLKLSCVRHSSVQDCFVFTAEHTELYVINSTAYFETCP